MHVQQQYTDLESEAEEEADHALLIEVGPHVYNREQQRDAEEQYEYNWFN